MQTLTLTTGLHVGCKQKLKLLGILKSVDFSLAPENVFRQYVRETEQETLFKKLAYPERVGDRVIRFLPFRNADWTCSLDQRHDLRDRSQPVVEALLAKAPGIRKLIARIGQERFCEYFLRNDGPLDRVDLARVCSVRPEELERLIDWVNEFFLQCHFTEPSSLTESASTVKVAAFERSGGEWVVRYFSPVMARGRYVVDYTRLKVLREMGKISAGDPPLKQLLRRIQLINERKTALDLVLQWFALRQRTYLESGDGGDLRPLQQKELASEVGRDRSTVCRILRGRSVLLPWEEERPLRELFVTRKQQMKLFWENDPRLRNLSDAAMREVFFRRFGVRLSRRSIRIYRRELGLPSRRGRRS